MIAVAEERDHDVPTAWMVESVRQDIRDNEHPLVTFFRNCLACAVGE